MDTATLRLFNAIQVIDHIEKVYDDEVIERGIRNGYILDPAISPFSPTLNTIESVVGISGEKANATFHKSWSVVRDASIEQLIIQQILHYVTTYGYEALGIYNQDTVYIPNEILELPKATDNIPLTVVHAFTKEEILQKIIDMGSSGIALHEETLNDIMTIVECNKYGPDFIDQINNRELATRLRDFYHLVPTEPTEYLRYVISKLTDETLIIKNQYLIDKIKEANGKFLDELLTQAPKDLASIFLRYKPLFLAMKSISRNKSFFNKLRKQSVKMHKPIHTDLLSNLTSRIHKGHFPHESLIQRLENANIFRKIRLAYALNYRLNPCNSIVYKIRNGRGWATEFNWPSELRDYTEKAFDIVFCSIVMDISKNVKGRVFYIPPFVHYALPATEKQFTGFLPTGTYVSTPQNMVAGIHWTNTENRVDLDLSVTTATTKLGWDADYRTPARSVMFSGDITDAPPPNGATELLYFKNELRSSMIMHVNYYNYFSGDEVLAKIVIAENNGEIDRDHMLDTSKVLTNPVINVNQQEMTLGLVVNVGGTNRFYFAPTSTGKRITSGITETSMHVRNYYVHSLVNGIDFSNVLREAGAAVVYERPEEAEYIDLSPENLDKNTIIDLICSREEK